MLFCGGAAFALMGNISAPSLPQLTTGEMGRVLRVIDGDSFVLALDDGRELSVRLSAIQAPRLALRGAKAWPYAEVAKAGLAALMQGRRVQLSYGGETRDRYGRATAQVHTLDGAGQSDLWVQSEMIRLGLARVFSWKGDITDIAAFYTLEIEAREHRRGIWEHEFYAVRRPDPDPLVQYVDSV